MATSSILPNLATGNTGAADLGIGNIGVKPVGNGAGSNLPGPSSVRSGLSPTGINPTQPIIPVNPVATTPSLPSGTTGTTGTGTSAYTTSLIPGVNPNQLSKQLTDEYGSGVGGVVGSELTNLGSQNSAYLQAYEKAVAQPNAENLATLQTTLGNEGVSADSSTAAIAQADFETGVTSDEALQEQQLVQSDINQQVGLTESLEGVANKDVSDSGWGVFGEVAGDIGGAVASALLI